MEKNFKSLCDLDLGPAMRNFELVRDIFIYYDVLKFRIHRSITFLVIAQKHRNTETRKNTQTLFCSVLFCSASRKELQTKFLYRIYTIILYFLNTLIFTGKIFM